MPPTPSRRSMRYRLLSTSGTGPGGTNSFFPCVLAGEVMAVALGASMLCSCCMSAADDHGTEVVPGGAGQGPHEKTPERQLGRGPIERAAQFGAAQALVQAVAAQQQGIAGINVELDHIQCQILAGADGPGQGMRGGVGGGLLRAQLPLVDQLLQQRVVPGDLVEAAA